MSKAMEKMGFKKTEVGLIPSDWEAKPLGEVVDFLDGKRKPIKDSDRAKMKGIYPYYGASGIIDYVNDYIFDEELILLGEDGENIISRNLRLAFKINGKAWINNHAHVLKPKDGYDINYLTEKLESINYEQYNTGTAQPKLNQKTCRSISIALPPTKAEQTAIATALNDADALITQLEKLIAKKKAIKQGAMQELLKPKEGWVVKKLGEMFEITSSKRVFQNQWQSKGIPFFRAREIAVLSEKGEIENELFITPELYEAFKRTFGVPKIGDILVTGVGTLGKVWMVKNNEPFYFKDGNIIWFKINGAINTEYLKQLFATKYIIGQIENATGKTTVGTYTITGAKKTLIPLPKSRDEQTRIAQILSDMDAEIEGLEKKLEKYRQIKQGMMQVLLTGKIRLV